MTDTYRRYRAIARSFLQLFPHTHGHHRRHLATLCLFISGVVGAQHCQLPKVVEQTPGGRAQDESVVMRLRRFLAHECTTYEQWMLPVAQALLAMLARQPLVFVIDGSTVARGCMGLMVSVLYRRRALPIIWLVIKANKGHMAEVLHCALLQRLLPLVPPDADVTIVGDGEFDGTTWQQVLQDAQWRYVCRTASTIVVHAHGTTFPIHAMGVTPGQVLAIPDAAMTTAAFGPVSVLAVWETGYAEPIYLVTNHADLDRAMAIYRRRAQIETFFSDQKSRGFRIDRSHLGDPQRVARLLLVTALAYLWVIYLGIIAKRNWGSHRCIRADRCDLSLFSLGLRFLASCLRHRRPLPYRLPKTLVRARQQAITCSVR